MAAVEVGDAHSGETAVVSVDGDARAAVAAAWGRDAEQQIVLVGPPWRPLDSATLDDDDDSEGSRRREWFVYDRGVIKGGVSS
eukprot:CAMPEP_0118904368 /NCGR_PEP_ID=MMETSP1166-20130328/8866_1 /TAXON_ID=1104430 /ORGANISM="Chrysoreinhardia sp, Strain CCMP3193" /LENGTH=82 /DNA_ID=CAMNT_0006843625 /DNA_START=287 /DNA_END=532 /DNA_ORIENTATION=+